MREVKNRDGDVVYRIYHHQGGFDHRLMIFDAGTGEVLETETDDAKALADAIYEELGETPESKQ